jgi:DNA-binding MarR family transcriptional regulator
LPYGVKDLVECSFLRSAQGKKAARRRAGLIEIAAGDKDARQRAVWLTEKGALSLEAGLADWKRAHSELAKRLNPEAARRLALAAEALEEG